MKNILVLIHDDPGQEARLRAALDLARAVGGRLTCLDVAVARVFPGDGMGSDAGLMMLDYESETEAANKVRLVPRLAAQSVPWEWIDTTGFLEASVEEAAENCDLIVVSRHCESFPSPDIDRAVAALIVKSGKPVLAVPDDSAELNLAGSALVAWDGSPAAFAALAAAVPLLQLAKSVTLLQIDDGSVRAPASDAEAYLKRHGIAASISRRPASLERTSVAILAAAQTGEYAYLVMGGYSHGRVVEALFGGVTRRMLKESPIPLFLAH